MLPDGGRVARDRPPPPDLPDITTTFLVIA
jgi:hypothetical protein